MEIQQPASSDGIDSITIGTTPITSGTVGAILFQGTGNVVQEDATSLFYGYTNKRLGLGTNLPTAKLHVVGSSDEIQFLLQGNSSQTANILQIKNSAGVAITGIDDTGLLTIANTGVYGIHFTGANAGIQVDSSVFNIDINAEPAIFIDIVNSNVAFGLSNSTSGGNAMNYGISNIVGGALSGSFGIGNNIGVGGAFAFGSGIDNEIANSLMIGPSDAAKLTILSSGNVGLGITPTSRLDIQGTTAMNLPTYSAEFLLSTGWTSTDWTGSFGTGWTHTTGNVSVLSQSTAAVSATKYQIAYTVTGRTAGTFTITFGGQSISSLSATGAWGPTTSSTANLTITPTTDFDGTIVISIKSLTAASTAIFGLRSSDATARIEMRANTVTGNTFIGVNSGRYNTTGANNTSNGYQALQNNTTGNNNTASGSGSLAANTTGLQNSGYGVFTLNANTSGQENTAIGYSSLKLNTSGSQNISVGSYSLSSNTTGSSNTAIGYTALLNTTTSNNNVAIGNAAGRWISGGTIANITSGTSVYVGSSAYPLADGDANEIVIGHNAVGNGSNTATWGNTSILNHYFTGNINLTNLLSLGNQTTAFDTTHTNPVIYSTSNSGSVYPFLTAGNLVLQSRASGAIRDIVFVGNTTPAVQMVIQGSTGNVGIGTTSPQTTLDINGGMRTATNAKSANYTITATDSTIYATTGVGGITVTLPAASANTIGMYYFVYKVDAGVGLLTVAAAGTDTINGVSSKTIANQWNGMLVRGLTATSWLATSFTGI